MFWESPTLMTMVDVALLSAIVLTLVTLERYRSVLREAGALAGARIALVGLLTIGLLYLLDLVSMYVLPPVVGRDRAMTFMRDLHLEYSWPLLLVGLILVVAGFLWGARNLRSLIEGLGHSRTELEQELKAHRAAEERLRESEGRHRSLIDNAPICIHEVDLRGNLDSMNQAGLEMLGLAERDVLGRPVLDFVAAADRDMVRALMDEAFLGRSVRFDFRTDGVPPKVFASSFIPILDSDGEVVRLSGVTEEITERVTADEALRRSEEYFRSLIENAQDIITVVDQEGVIRYQSPSVEWLLGYRPAALVDRAVIDYVHPEDRERVQIAVAYAFAHPGTARMVEYRFRHRDGSWRSLESIGMVRSREGGQLHGVMNSRDVSDRRQAEWERERLEIQLRRSQQLETIGTLAGGVAHDFNNILTPIFGYVEMALEEIPEGNQARSDLQQVLAAARRARDLINQILTFSRQAEQNRVPVRPDLIVREALRLLRASLPSTIEIRERSSSTELVLADSTRVHQVIMNLGTNAFHAMRSTGGVLELTVERVEVTPQDVERRPELKPGVFVRIGVEDSGQGMNQRVMARIFDPFFTTKDSQEGTGLGLSVVLGIVQDHDGVLTVASEPGRGTRFDVYLPVIERPAPVPRPEPEGEVEGTEHILFVDDEPAIGRMAQRLLERFGYQVTAVSDSIEALSLFRKNPSDYDLVITDYTMPSMTGSELARAMLEAAPGTPVILMTGFSDTMTPERARELGIRSYVMKPVVAKELGAVIRRVLDGAMEPG